MEDGEPSHERIATPRKGPCHAVPRSLPVRRRARRRRLLAQDGLADAPERVAGTLTSLTRPDPSLVVGRSPVAECTFTGQRRFGTPGRLGSPARDGGRADDVERSDRIVRRVWTLGGTGPDARYEGPFLTHPIDDARTAARFAGENAELERVSHPSRNTAIFMHGHGRIGLAAR